MNAEIIAIGSELLTPFRTDTNSLFLTEQLNKIGVEVVQKTIVGDDRVRLTETIAQACRRSPLVITIGGLGPTEDDLTREAAAAALGRPLLHDDRLVETIESRFRARGLSMPEINLRQAKRIAGAEIFENSRGTAPGQWVEQEGRVLILLPGPPRELEPMFLDDCLPRLRRRVPQAFLATAVLRIAGLPESSVDEIAAPIYRQDPNVVTTILAAPGEIQLHFRSTAGSQETAEARVRELSARVEQALGKAVFSNDGSSLEQVVGRMLAERQATLAVAESCTGGLVARRITDVAGSSAYFLGGVVCYSNEWKTTWLGVPAALLESHGAVSEPVARALAEGVRTRSGASYGVGITGIAGPGGGTPEKPVGLVYIAVAGPEGCRVRENRYLGERETIRWQASQTALDMTRRVLAGTPHPAAVPR